MRMSKTATRSPFTATRGWSRLSVASINRRTTICQDLIKNRPRRAGGFGRRRHARSPWLRRLCRSELHPNPRRGQPLERNHMNPRSQIHRATRASARVVIKSKPWIFISSRHLLAPSSSNRSSKKYGQPNSQPGRCAASGIRDGTTRSPPRTSRRRAHGMA